MARLWSVGWESTTPTELGSLAGANVPVTEFDTVRTGDGALRCDSGGGNTASYWRSKDSETAAIVAGRWRYYRGYVYLPAAPSQQCAFFDIRVGATSGLLLRFNTAGSSNIHIRYFQAGVSTDGAAVPLPVASWVRIEIGQYIDAANPNAGALEFRLDGVVINALSGLNFGTAGAWREWFGWTSAPGANKVVYIDDLAINDDQGADQDSWPGSGNLIMLHPRKDNARGANWVAGAGGTSDIFDAVDLRDEFGAITSPSGKAIGSADNTTQVKNVTSDATGNYDARLEPYSVRILNSEVIKLVQPVFNVGCDSATATDGAEKLVSNPGGPAETAINFSTGAIAGTYPTNWRWDQLAAVYGDIAQRSVGPVVRIGKRQATARAAMCDVMGLYVEYTAAPATPVASGIRLGCDLGLDAKPMDSAYPWTNVDDHLTSFSYSWGRNNERNRIETGTGTVVLRDDDRLLDSDYASSQFYPNVKLKVPIRIVRRSDYGGFSPNLPLMTHYVSRWPRLRVGPGFVVRDVATHDGFGIFSRFPLGGQNLVEQKTYPRIKAVLAAIGWPLSRTVSSNNDDGQTTDQAIVFAADDDTRALTHLLDCAESENGLLCMNQAGWAAFVGRNELIYRMQTYSPILTFSDQPTGAEYGYTDPVYTNDDALLANDWTGQRVGGALQSASDAASIVDYGNVRQSLASQASTDADVLGAIQFRLTQFKTPLQRFESITVRPGDDETLWDRLVNLNPGDPIIVEEHLPGGGPVLSNRYLVQGVTVTHPGGPWSNTTWRLNLWPVAVAGFAVMDDAAFGLFDSMKFAY
jgi:hypothetical protein